MPVSDPSGTHEQGKLSFGFYLNSLDPSTRELYTSKASELQMNEGETLEFDPEQDMFEDLCNVLQNERSGVDLWLTVAKAYAQKGKVEDSASIIRSALDAPVIKESSNDVRSMLNTFLSWLYLSKQSQVYNQSTEFSLSLAQQEIRTAQQLNPSNECAMLADAVYSLLSKKEAGVGRTNYDNESKTFDKLLDKNPNNCYALMGKAKIFFLRQSYLSALRVFQKILKINPLLNPDSRIGIGLCFWMLNRKDLAFQAWQNSLQVFPEDNLSAKILLSMCKFDEAFLKSANDEEFEANYASALEFIKASFNESPNNNVILLILASYYFSKEDYNMVESLCNKVLKSKLPEASNVIQSEAQFWLARCQFAKKDFLASQKLFSISIRLNESNLLSRIGYGQCQIVRNEIGDATRTFEKLYESNSKVLEVSYILGMLYSKTSKYVKRAIEILDKYVKLSMEQNEPVNISALLTLSTLHEEKDMSQSLKYLNIAKEQELLYADNDVTKVPYALLNNVGVFSLLRNEANSEQIFEDALESLKESSTELTETQEKAVEITLKYNIARCKESTGEPKDVETAMELYDAILAECPDYSNAKIRWLLLAVTSKDQNIKNEVEELLKDFEDDLEVRSFYGWYIKRFGRKHQVNKATDFESKHYVNTLSNYDSHDTYALISLGNVYCSLARDTKVTNGNAKEQQKKDGYYSRSAQLYHKVLSLDPRNVYAAQGIAIILAERKQSGLALEIFKKVRDSLQDVSIYLNLGHCLLEVKQFSKAIESYNIALSRFTNNQDSKILVYLGRAWLLRGLSEGSLVSLKTALQYSEKAYEISKLSSVKFNTAFVQFQIADFIRKLPTNKRTLEDLEYCYKELESAIKSLNELSDEKHPPYPAEDLKSRASMGTNTLIKQLERCIAEQKEYDDLFTNKLNEAKKIQEEEERLQKELREKEEQARIMELERLAAERKALEEKSKEWNQLRIEEEKDAKDELDGDDGEAGTRKKRKSSAPATKKGSKRQKKQKETSVSDDEAEYSSSGSESDAGSDASNNGNKSDEEEDAKSTDDESKSNSNGNSKSKKKRTKSNTKSSKVAKSTTPKSTKRSVKRKQKIVDDEDEDEDEDSVRAHAVKGKSSTLSKETIDDSDDESDEGVDDVPRSSAKIDDEDDE